MIAAMNELLLGPEQTLVHFFNASANQLQREITTSDLFGYLLKSTIALFVVLNPIGTVPLFIATHTKYEKGRTKSSFKDGYIYFRYCPSSHNSIILCFFSAIS